MVLSLYLVFLRKDQHRMFVGFVRRGLFLFLRITNRVSANIHVEATFNS